MYNNYFRFKFDDERVTKENVKRALEEQYGGEEEVNNLVNSLKKKSSFENLTLTLNSELSCFVCSSTVTTNQSWFHPQIH